jgi:hypothetical protein
MKDIKLFIYYTIILLLLISVYLTRNYLKYKNFSEYPVQKLKKENIKTGDIFLVAYHKPGNLLGDLIMKVRFNHVSLAVWEKDELYLIEYANYFDKYQGLLKIKYQDWIRFNKNTTILKNSISGSRDKELETKILNYYENNRNKMDQFKGGWNMSWYRFLYKKNKYLPLDLSYQTTCTEIMSSLLGNIGVINNTKALSDYHQSDFIDMKGFSLSQGIKYKKDYLCSLSN